MKSNDVTIFPDASEIEENVGKMFFLVFKWRKVFEKAGEMKVKDGPFNVELLIGN